MLLRTTHSAFLVEEMAAMLLPVMFDDGTRELLRVPVVAMPDPNKPALDQNVYQIHRVPEGLMLRFVEPVCVPGRGYLSADPWALPVEIVSAGRVPLVDAWFTRNFACKEHRT